MMKQLTFFVLFFLFLGSCSQKKTHKFRNNLQNTGFFPSGSVESPPDKLWQFKTDGEVYASPVFDEKNIYFGSGDQYFYCLDSENGEMLWKYKTRGKIYSSAVVKNRSVYFLSYDGFLYKLNKNSGRLIWKFKTLGEEGHLIKNYYNTQEMVKDFWDFYQSSPSIDDQTIYFGCGKKFYAVDIHSGHKKWHYTTRGVIHSSPALKDDKVFFGSFDSRMYCLDKQTGSEIWQFETGRDTVHYVWLGIQSSPAIDDDKLFFGSRDASIYCLNIHTGEPVWTNNNFDRSWMPSSFAVDHEFLYCGSSDSFNFYIIDKATGKIIENIATHSYTFSSPAIDHKMAYIGSSNGRLYGIGLKNQSVQWQFITDAAKEDTLGVYNDQGILDKEKLRDFMNRTKPGNYSSLVDRYAFWFKSSGAILSSPIIHHQVIYFGSADGSVYALKSGKNTKDL